MDAIEQAFEAAFEEHQLPGVVVTAQDRSRRINYAKAFGNISLKPSTQPMQIDNAFWLASVSKEVTTIAALQSVDRGYFTLDEDITRILPEFRGIQILEGFDGKTGEPILVTAKNKITLRLLLSHSSGIGYDHFNPPLIQYRKRQGHPTSFHRPGRSSDNYFYPLLFEPGTSFGYGAGIDWAGIMTCRVNDNISLEDYIQKNICAPLNIKSMTFHLDRHPEITAKLAGTTLRAGGLDSIGLALDPRGKVEHTDYEWWPVKIEDDVGGAGLVCNPIDLQKILTSLTLNDGILLKPSTVLEMHKPQMSLESKKALMDSREGFKGVQSSCQGQPPGADLDFGLGACLNLTATADGRHKGTLGWTGLPNVFWWVDQEAGVSGTLFMTLLPMGDLVANEFYNKFQRAVYDMLES